MARGGDDTVAGDTSTCVARGEAARRARPVSTPTVWLPARRRGRRSGGGRAPAFGAAPRRRTSTNATADDSLMLAGTGTGWERDGTGRDRAGRDCMG